MTENPLNYDSTHSFGLSIDQLTTLSTLSRKDFENDYRQINLSSPSTEKEKSLLQSIHQLTPHHHWLYFPSSYPIRSGTFAAIIDYLTVSSLSKYL